MAASYIIQKRSGNMGQEKLEYCAGHWSSFGWLVCSLKSFDRASVKWSRYRYNQRAAALTLTALSIYSSGQKYWPFNFMLYILCTYYQDNEILIGGYNRGDALYEVVRYEGALHSCRRGWQNTFVHTYWNSLELFDIFWKWYDQILALKQYFEIIVGYFFALKSWKLLKFLIFW